MTKEKLIELQQAKDATDRLWRALLMTNVNGKSPNELVELDLNCDAAFNAAYKAKKEYEAARKEFAEQVAA